MNHFWRLSRLSILIIATAYSLLPTAPASAAQTSWQWSDVSSRISIRQNRPVWAMAQAGGVWYFTDGQAFAKGGHVWRTNGTTSDITRQLQNAGLTRVDDIVSNGSIALFLQDVYAQTNAFKIVSTDGGAFTDRTGRLHAWFADDEGIASIQGSTTEWSFVSTKGKIRIFGDLNNIRSRPDATSGQEPATPIADIGNFASDLAYTPRHVSPADGRDYLPAAAVPYAGGWFLATKTADGLSFLQFNSKTGLTDMGAQIGAMQRIHAIASNGASVLLAGSASDDGSTNRIFLIESGRVTDLSEKTVQLPFQNWNRTIIGWNGTAWMIVSGKELVRFDGSTFTSLGKTRDYFLNIAGSSNGTLFLGGVVSDIKTDRVPAKLSAKLVKVLEK